MDGKIKEMYKSVTIENFGYQAIEDCEGFTA